MYGEPGAYSESHPPPPYSESHPLPPYSMYSELYWTVVLENYGKIGKSCGINWQKLWEKMAKVAVKNGMANGNDKGGANRYGSRCSKRSLSYRVSR